jgi:pre-60S factor REI1
LEDIEGLVEYLKEKALIGYTCWYCDKGFSGWEPTIQHMVDKCHCKLPYDGTDDEIQEYYDFGDDDDMPAGGEPAPAAASSDEGEWEDADGEDATPGAGDGETASTARARLRLRRAGPEGSTVDHPTLENVDDEVIGDMVQELILPDGRRAGHRSLNVYYKQSVRPEAREQHDMITKLITSYRGMGYQMAVHRGHHGRPILTRAEKREQKQGWIRQQHNRTHREIKQNKINVGPRGSGWNPRYGAEKFM